MLPRGEECQELTSEAVDIQDYAGQCQHLWKEGHGHRWTGGQSLLKT